MNIIKTNFNPQIPLSKIEEFVANELCWEKGSFAVMLLMFSDRQNFIYISYPKELNENLPNLLLDMISSNIELFNTQNQPHPATKPDMKVNGGALNLALNALRRAGKTEIADELELTAERSS